MTFRIYDKLCEDAKKLRTEVFVAEQGFETEFDDTDSKARHIVAMTEKSLSPFADIFTMKNISRI